MNDQIIEYTPSTFIAVFNQSIEYSFNVVMIEGEISSFRIAKGRWVYFDIKDEEATLRCFGTVYMLPGPLEDGMLVRIVCAPRLHPQFNFSMNIQSIMPVGQGAIAKQAELLFRKLDAEGIFAPERKRPIVYPPERIALVTSSESAAYADFAKIMNARWPFANVDVYDVQVQGQSAAEQIKLAIESANSSGEEYDVLVLIRGGGSAEDLAAFNDERIIRAIAGSRIPSMVAIGHEVDESLSELASDMRASTPSNAAELLVPDQTVVQADLESLKANLFGSLRSVVFAQRELIHAERSALILNLQAALVLERQTITHAHSRLALLNPREVLKRGYGIVRKSGKTIKSGADLLRGDEVAIIFTDIERKATINE